MTLSVATRIFIISDTHGMDFGPQDTPLQHANVAIHCGDLTDGSKLEEYRTAIELLKKLDAPLKLVIAGNHDFTLDVPAFEKIVKDSASALEPELIEKEYGRLGEARSLFRNEAAEAAGITFLDEGTHQFILENGAKLTVYASSYTPSLSCGWGFQYHPEQNPHKFNIPHNVDVAITHGPPKGIMDYTSDGKRAGCSNLFTAIANSRPKIHCFGHIHEGWGGKLVTWRDTFGEIPTYFTAIDNDSSPVIMKLANLRASKYDTEEDAIHKTVLVQKIDQERCVRTNHCTGQEYPITFDKQTLFINAAYTGVDEIQIQRPWLVDVELSVAE